MSCTTLTSGRGIDCRNSAGGVKALYLVPFNEATIVRSSGEVTDFDCTNLFKYEVKRGMSSITETIVGSTENGSIHYTQAVNMKLHKLSKIDQNEIKLLAGTRLVIFAELNQTLASGNNAIFCLGADNGLELNAGTNSSGVALGDASGYDWTFDGMEVSPMSIVADYTSEPFDNSSFTKSIV
tara:strand:- start:2635 stop:3180 length:546 start_codon:yes stop_codon:yes gene_type:complete